MLGPASARGLIVVLWLVLWLVAGVHGENETSATARANASVVAPQLQPEPALTLLIPHADLQDEEAAYLFRRVIFGSASIVKRSLRLIAKAVRSSGDTFAGLVSGVIKATGGVFNLLADALSEISLPLIRPRAPNDRMPHSIEHIGRRIGRGMRALSNVLFAVGESCILAGETTEVLTVGLGQSVEDSFAGLELLMVTVQQGAERLLTPRRRVRRPSGEYVWYVPRGRVAKERRGGNASLPADQPQGQGLEQERNDSTRDEGRRDEAHPHARAQPPPPPASASSTPQQQQQQQQASPYPSFIEQLHSRFFGEHSAAELQGDRDGVSWQRVLLGALGTWLLLPFSFHSAAGLSPPSISAHVLGGMGFIALMSSLTYASRRRRVLVLLCCCLMVWVYLLAMDTVIRQKVESRVGVRAVGSFLQAQMDEHQRAKRAQGGTDAAQGGAGRFFETSVWVNVLLGALWNLEGHGSNPKQGYLHGGLGPYIGDIWEAMLNEQLALVPPGVANLQLKRFSLGRQAPLVRAVRFDARHDAICLSPSAAAPSASLHDRWRAFQHDHGLGAAQPDARAGSQGGSRTQGHARAASCQHLVADVDFSYQSRDMDIIFSLRSPDVKSVLPEATVRLSEISLSGTVRIDAELTADYPFVGNASISFLRLPVLDTAISSFGGVDLAAIPGVYTWINITMTWLLGQFTAPNSGAVDLRKNICPSCDGKPAPSTAEALQGAAEAVGKGLRDGVDKAWSALQAMRRRRAAQPEIAALAVPRLGSNANANAKANAEASDPSDPPPAPPPPPPPPPSLVQSIRDLLLRSQWSNGVMTCNVLVIIFLLFRLLRKPAPLPSV